jgi:hypothetical protein
MQNKFYSELFESPDIIQINNNKFYYSDKSINQRSFIIYSSEEIWISKIGEVHDDVKNYEIESYGDQNALNGRIWLDPSVISFWHSPVSMYGNKYLRYINALEEKLKTFSIELHELNFDTYESWKGIGKKICEPSLMVKYYSNSETPLDDYRTYIAKMQKYVNSCMPPSEVKITKSGSPKTAWDSKNNIIARRSRFTSESIFYPELSLKKID